MAAERFLEMLILLANAMQKAFNSHKETIKKEYFKDVFIFLISFTLNTILP